MSKGVLVCFASVVFVSAVSAAPATTAAGTLNVAREDHTATLLTNGKVLIAGGAGPLNSAELYDPVTRTYTATANMTAGRARHTATLLHDGKVLIAGGGTVTAELYDPVGGTFTPTGSLPVALNGHTATRLPDSRVLIVGGNFGGRREAYVYAGGTFAATSGLMTYPRFNHTATLLSNGRVLVVGGSGSTTNEIFDPSTNTFATTGSTMLQRSEHTATGLPGGKVLIAGGTLSTANLELYDPVSGTFSNSGSLWTARVRHTATLLPNGTVLIASGTMTTAQATHFSDIYDPATGTASVIPLLTARERHTGTLLADGTVLLAGGRNSTGVLSSVERHDTQNPGAFSARTNTSHTEGLAATTLMDGRVLATHGLFSRNVSIWDSVNGMVAQGGLMPTSHAFGTATLMPGAVGEVLVMGGYDSTGIDSWIPQTNTWSTVAQMSVLRINQTTTMLPNGNLLIAGGWVDDGNATVHATAEVYDRQSRTVVGTGSMTSSRMLHTATLLRNGKVLVVGGLDDASQHIPSAELYDSDQGTFTPSGAVQTVRFRHTATLLEDGKVLIAGGVTEGGQVTATAELYDSSSGTFTAVGSMGTPRSDHTATLLLDGTVLMAGSGTVSELYDPKSGTFRPVAALSGYRVKHRAVMLADGRVLMVGGIDNGVAAGYEIFDPGHNPSRQAVVAANSGFGEDNLFIEGTGFAGDASGGGGSTTASSADHPVLRVERVDNGEVHFANLIQWNGTAAVSEAFFERLSTGTYRLGLISNGVPSSQKIATYAIPQPTGTISPSRGPVGGGQLVTVTGARLAGATVKVDGIRVTPTSSSDSELTFVTPPHAAGTVQVVITNRGGYLSAPYTYGTAPAPDYLTAATAENASVGAVYWARVPGVALYDIERSVSGSTFVKIAETAQTTTPDQVYFDRAVSRGTAYLYRVRGVDVGNQPGEYSPRGAVVVMPFTDYLLPGVVIKRIHLEELRSAVNALRQLGQLPVPSYTDPIIVSGVTSVKAIHFNELDVAIDAACAALGVPPFNGPGFPVSAGQMIEGYAHVHALRAKLNGD